MKNKIAIVTDTNSGITQEEAKELGIYLIAMPFFINKNTYYEGITLSQEEFFKKLEDDENISTFTWNSNRTLGQPIERL